MADHTPLPWRTGTMGHGIWGGPDQFHGAWVTNFVPRPADAALIVRAVNHHEALVKAAWDVLHACLVEDGGNLRRSLDALRAVLAAVEASEPS